MDKELFEEFLTSVEEMLRADPSIGEKMLETFKEEFGENDDE